MDWTRFADEHLVSMSRAVPGSAWPTLTKAGAIKPSQAAIGLARTAACSADQRR